MILMGALPAAAQPHETFAEHPAKRQDMVQAAHERAQHEKEEARQWAKDRGLRMRQDDGQRVMELMAIRNGRPVYYTTHNAHAAISTAADQVLNTVPYAVNGSGIKVGIWDGGTVLTTHQEFGSRVFNADGAGSHIHSTHVGGTIGASGVVADAMGMAPNVSIDSYDWNADVAEMTSAAASIPNETDKVPLSNHSYGTLAGWTWASWSGNTGFHWFGNIKKDNADSFFGQYDHQAGQWDQIVYNAPYYLPFKSAGNHRNDNPSHGTVVYHVSGPFWSGTTYNSNNNTKGDGVYKGGYDTLSTDANAKNIVTVGAVNDAVSGSSRSVSNATMLSFSSWGPADDGRIKPDVVANGYELKSTVNTGNADYEQTFWSGTSMATPNACGSAALLVDYFDDRFPGNAMRASTLKGLIIHTADDLGRPGPDYEFGWGLVNTLTAAELIKDYANGNMLRITESELNSTTNTVDTLSMFSNGMEPLRITLCWTDPPSAATNDVHDSRIPKLVNDLDLKVIGPGGTNYPYRLDYNNPGDNALVDSENNIDNVEQVYIDAPIAGQYTVLVDYDESLEDGNQWYSLLISGITSDVDDDGLPNDWEIAYFGGATNAVAYFDSDGDGLDNLSEYISGFDPTDSNSVFEITTFSVPTTGGAPFIVTWDSVEGRVYNVDWSSNLVFMAFTNISDSLLYPANSYTDGVERVGHQQFYRVDVLLAE